MQNVKASRHTDALTALEILLTFLWGNLCEAFKVWNVGRFGGWLQRRGFKSALTLGATGWLSQLSVQLLISAQVMILWFVSSSPASGSSPTAQSLLGILSLPLSLPLPCLLSFCQK